MQLNPTFSHETLKSLVETGHVCHIVTQNIDNLHLRSGVLAENQSELHGNFSLEICPLCEARYYREFAVWQGLTAPSTASSNVVAFRSQGNSKSQKSAAVVTVTKKRGQSHDHKTGRYCEAENCCGELESSVVLFGEDLPAKVCARKQNPVLCYDGIIDELTRALITSVELVLSFFGNVWVSIMRIS